MKAKIRIWACGNPKNAVLIINTADYFGGFMPRNTSVTLGEHFEKFINQQIQLGHYGSISEIIREGLRMVEDKEKKRELLRLALIEGEKSGRIKQFSMKDLINALDQEEGE